VRADDPFQGFERDLNYWELPDETMELALGASDLPRDERQRRFVAYVGLFDLLIEALWAACDNDEERDHEATRVLWKFQSVEPTLRFSLYGQSDLTRRAELASRMRGKEVAVTEHFMLPRLEEGLGLYEDRIEALRAALREA